MNLEFEDINSAQLYFLKFILESGNKIETRGLSTLEISPAYFCITNPRARITTLKARKWKLAPALGELSWHLSASKDVKFISSYLSNWSNFSEDKTHITGSCYGAKIFQEDQLGKTKWNSIISLLNEDPNSRRAVIPLLDSSDVIDGSKLDVSCTLSLQFLIRNGSLDIIVNMRSNDMIWGLPYDIFLFSYLQEFMAIELKIPIGKYYHFASSLHIYEKHIDMVRKIIAENENTIPFIMPTMPNNNVKEFIDFERQIRQGIFDYSNFKNIDISPYWIELLKVLYFQNGIKHGNTIESSELKQNSYYGDLL